ncbi:cell division protein FtsX [Pseudomonas putida S11]|nr:cell division protein FtsX [Pseudomonas putida S11]
MLRLLLAMERPTSGKLMLAGQDLGQISNSQIPFLRRQIGVVFQNHQLLFDRTVFNNIALPLQILGLSKAEVAKRVDSALERVSLADKGELFPADLSTGQQQRVGIARAIVHQPALLLADEPTGNLDPRLAAEISGGVRGHQPPGYHGIDRQPRPGTDCAHASPHADLAARPLDRRWGGRAMSTTRTPKVSEPGCAETGRTRNRRRKSTTTMTARISARCCMPGWKATVPAWPTACAGWASSRSAASSPALVMAVALSMPMGLSLLLKNVEKLGGSWQRAAQISLYLKLDAGSREGEALRDEIKGMPGVADAQYVSREQALEEFQQQSGLGEALRELPDNPLPGVVVVTPTEVDKPALEALRQRLSELPRVEVAQLDLVWVERLAAILKRG